ncbi:hypothetical protein D3C78_1647830 [compost metagenome]
MLWCDHPDHLLGEGATFFFSSAGVVDQVLVQRIQQHTHADLVVAHDVLGTVTSSVGQDLDSRTSRQLAQVLSLHDDCEHCVHVAVKFDPRTEGGLCVSNRYGRIKQVLK